MKKKIVSIIGTGVIGAGWAARFLARGYIVKAYDPNIDSLENLYANVLRSPRSKLPQPIDDSSALPKQLLQLRRISSQQVQGVEEH